MTLHYEIAKPGLFDDIVEQIDKWLPPKPKRKKLSAAARRMQNKINANNRAKKGVTKR